MYDFPNENGELQPGRISLINNYKPSLVVSLHMTPAARGNKGGMAAVLAPAFKSYDLIRRIHLNQEKIQKWHRSPWKGKVLETEAGWSQYQLMRGDAWGYFHGYRSNQKGTAPNMKAPRGIRHNLISWSYKESDDWEKKYAPNQAGPYALDYKRFHASGKFWEREKSKKEEWRREDGLLGYGGDNHYATDELMRFVQHGARLFFHKKPQNKIGTIHSPFVSSYTLPIYVNAIVAFIEIGYINRKRDRNLLTKERDIVAQSLAVGIYSLYSGLTLRSTKKNNPHVPRGRSLDFKKYENYFETSSQ